MKSSFRRLFALLLAPLVALNAADESKPAPKRPLVGVIRWDGCTSSPYVTQQQEMGF
jgi:hypothetical protein